MTVVGGWRSRINEALVLLLVIASVSRVVWELLAPAVPLLLGVLVVVALFGFVLQRRNHW